MKTVFVTLVVMILVCCDNDRVICAPLRKPKDIVFVPVNRPVPLPFVTNNYPYQPYNAVLPNSNPQIRGPFDFIGNWIQSSEWFPIELNVPDAFNNLGNGFQQFTQGLGNGFNQFTQGVGNGFNQFTQGLGNGFQQISQNVGNGLNGFIRNTTQVVPFLGNIIRPRFPPNVLFFVPNTQSKVDFNRDVEVNNIDAENRPLNSLADDVFVGYP